MIRHSKLESTYIPEPALRTRLVWKPKTVHVVLGVAFCMLVAYYMGLKWA